MEFGGTDLRDPAATSRNASPAARVLDGVELRVGPHPSWSWGSLLRLISSPPRECDSSPSGRALSRQHARLTPWTGGVLVEDLGSTNGTSVNGNRIHCC